MKVADLFKSLRDKYTTSLTTRLNKRNKKPQANQIEVHIHKLFARHIPVKEQADSLAKKVYRPVINVYLGTPGRIKALAEAGAIALNTKKLKTIVFDCTPN